MKPIRSAPHRRRKLSSHRQTHGRRAPRRLRRDPSRLRFPGGKSRAAARLRGCWRHLHRPDRGSHGSARLKNRRPPTRAPLRRPQRSRHQRSHRKPSSKLSALAENMGFPVLLKAVAGGGGKGMRLVNRADEFASAFRDASSEAMNSFGDGRVYSKNILTNRATWKFRSSPTLTAASFLSASANAPCSAATRKSSRKLLLRS